MFMDSAFCGVQERKFMKIELHAEEGDSCTSMEIANALIKNFMETTLNGEQLVYNKYFLLAIAEHIQVHFKYADSYCMEIMK